MAPLPYLTGDLPGIGGEAKQTPEDFQVDELPLYQPCGEGTHVYFRVRKSGMSTPATVARIARHMGVKPHDIGAAGLKDARAVTGQMMSLEHADPAALAAFRDASIQISDISRHTNKLRTGHLAGNRFAIRIRGVGAEQLARAAETLDVLIRRGVPNYFGPQRFGSRGDTAALGKALVTGDLDEFVRILLGGARNDDPPDCKAARDAFDAGFYDRALGRWPRRCHNERRALAAFKPGGRPGPAVAAIDKRMKRLYVSACQSAVFNEVLSGRIDSIDRLFAGDMAQKTDTGGAFIVEDPAADQPRAARFEISPTGPVPGYRCNLAEGEPGRAEREALAGQGVQLEDFRRLGALKAKGTRRALRFRIDQPALAAGRDERGEFLELTFTAGSGCYATVVLREIMKTDAAP